MKVVKDNYSDGYCGGCGKRVDSRWMVVDNDEDNVIALCHTCLMELLDAIIRRE